MPRACRSTRGCARIEDLYKPYHRALRRVLNRIHRALRGRRAGRLSLHALVQPRPGRAAARRHRAGRPLRHELRAGDHGLRRCAAAAARPSGHPQQALCGRLHHRALRQPGRRLPCHPGRDQPRPLHGRAEASRCCPPSTRWPATWSLCATGSPPCRCTISRPSARRPSDERPDRRPTSGSSAMAP